MMLEAVWFKDGKEVKRIDPVMNLLCDEDMNDISEIEINNGEYWYSSETLGIEADDFVIRIKKV